MKKIAADTNRRVAAREARREIRKRSKRRLSAPARVGANPLR
jgi:hypothetical protein